MGRTMERTPVDSKRARLWHDYYRCLERVGQPRASLLRSAPERESAYVLGRIAARRPGLALPMRARVFYGPRLRVTAPESVSMALVRYGIFEEGLTGVLLAYLAEGACFYDVGAHYGYFTLLASLLVGSTGEIHSFEPTPSTYRILGQNLGSVRARNVRTNPLAVWNASDVRLELQDMGGAHSSLNSLFQPRSEAARAAQHSLVPVRTTTLDDYVARGNRPPDLLKVDAESAEYQVIEGARGILTRARPLVTLEIGDMDVAGARSTLEIIDEMARLGYTPFEWRENALAPHQRREKYEYDNLVFVPGERGSVVGADRA